MNTFGNPAVLLGFRVYVVLGPAGYYDHKNRYRGSVFFHSLGSTLNLTSVTAS